MYGAEIQMRDLVNFCDNYGCGYGKAEIIELKDKFIITLYNAGWSTNEEMDTEFRKKYGQHIFLDKHPLIFAEFSKLDLSYGGHVVGYENLKGKCDCYKKKKKFKYTIEIE